MRNQPAQGAIMATTFTIENEFPKIPVEKFEKYLNHPDLNKKLAGMPAFRSRELIETKTTSDGGTEWRFKVVAGGNVPPAVQRVVSEDMFTWHETSRFSPSEHCIHWNIEPIQTKVKFSGGGTWKLSEAQGGTHRVIEGEIKVGIPFVGKLVEGFIVNELKRNYEVEPALQEEFYSNVN